MKKVSLLVLAAVLILFAIAIYSSQEKPGTVRTKEDAIRQAEEYQPDGACTNALVPAVHQATGAKYTFRSGCLAPGWKPEQ